MQKITRNCCFHPNIENKPNKLQNHNCLKTIRELRVQRSENELNFKKWSFRGKKRQTMLSSLVEEQRKSNLPCMGVRRKPPNFWQTNSSEWVARTDWDLRSTSYTVNLYLQANSLPLFSSRPRGSMLRAGDRARELRQISLWCLEPSPSTRLKLEGGAGDLREITWKYSGLSPSALKPSSKGWGQDIWGETELSRCRKLRAELESKENTLQWVGK